MIDETQLLSMWLSRQQARDPLFGRALQIQNIYNGTFAIPLAELDDTEMPATVNLINQGINQNGMRIAASLPDPRYFALRPGIKLSEEKARDRRLANLHWWDTNKQGLKLRRRARHMIAYGSSCASVTPDPQLGMPRWDVRDPLSAYPAYSDFDEPVPSDCLFANARSAGWVRQQYGDAAWDRMAKQHRQLKADDEVTVIEYFDDEEISRWIVGWRGAKPMENQAPWVDAPTWEPYAVRATPAIENRTGRPLVSVPQGIGLDRPMGQMEGLIGTYQKQAQIDALQYIGMKRGIYPETWLVGRVGDTPRVVKMADPLQGRMGIVEGGDIRDIANVPEFTTSQFVDRYERNQRVQGGIPPEFGGESATNVRTGRRGEAVISAAIDFNIQEAQEILADAMTEENRMAIAVEKAYFPGEHTINSSATKGKLTYIPGDLWETDDHKCRFSYSGVDQSRLLIEMGQRYGMESISKRTLMEVDPLVEDPEFENDRVQFEQLERVMMTAMTARAQADPQFVEFLPEIAKSVLTDEDDLFEAYTKASEKIKAAQAAAAAGAAPGGAAAQPGLAEPGLPPSIGPVPEGAQNLTGMLLNLRRGQQVAQPTFGEGGSAA